MISVYKITKKQEDCTQEVLLNITNGFVFSTLETCHMYETTAIQQKTFTNPCLVDFLCWIRNVP